MPDFRLEIGAAVSDDQLNALFDTSWPAHVRRSFGALLARSLAHVCAFQGDRLIGFVNLAWDGGEHAFLLDPTIHPDFRRRGLGTRLVLAAVAVALDRGLRWVHVDFEPELAPFYRACGFRSTSAGIIALNERRGS